MPLSSESTRDLIILEQIEQDPDATQASLATRLGVAVGTVNWHLKRLIAKGYIKVRRVERRKLRYLITPEGVALRTRLTLDYIRDSFQLYRQVRERALTVIEKVRESGYRAVRLEGEGEVAEVCRLTCLEQGLTLVDNGRAPVIRVHNLTIQLDFPNEAADEY
ncbi:winged helix-turn-helix transcriptional regulator [Thermanaerothrix sp.]|jgi:DNA-binding MarR family transcriptional regulator|uniref:winged helix-turn-helix transcriptional regulator n=1 Tax=Thermanaerothrix sp. TaxID=2972675 RepID=UPI002ADE4203|nr:winged helix-turn-helix transcriptional regulator [Thermanaerothrix sp.]